MRGGLSRFVLFSSALLALLSVIAVGVMARPVNDDFWAIQSLHKLGYWESLSWYYRDFQGNVGSWLLILFHVQQWVNGVTFLGSLISVIFLFALLILALEGLLKFLTIRLPLSPAGVAFRLVLSVAIWLSLDSIVSPNSLTFFLYMPSALVHAVPWLLLFSAPLLFDRFASFRVERALLFLISLVAGLLGFVEAFCFLIGGATAYRILRVHDECDIKTRIRFRWLGKGLIAGLVLQLIAPATWNRASLSSTGEALKSNLDAVGRAFRALDQVIPIADRIQSLAPDQFWARALVPPAVLSDLVIRPGLLILFGVALLISSLVSVQEVSKKQVAIRMKALAAVVAVSAIVYSMAGMTYAYAGRHVVGPATLLGFLIFAKILLVQKNGPSFKRSLSLVLSSVLALGLLSHQVSLAHFRKIHWDQAQQMNVQLLQADKTSTLVNVPIKSGLSSSGLRDHEGSVDYQDWLLRVQK